jgi:hypothetical protein
VTALSIERLVHPTRRSAAAPRIRAGLIVRATTIGKSVRAAQAFEAAVSPTAQLRVMERFAASIDR